MEIKTSRINGAISSPESTPESQGRFLWITKYTIYKTIFLFLPIIYNSTTYNKNSIYFIEKILKV